MRVFINLVLVYILVSLSIACSTNHYIGNAIQYYSIATVPEGDQAVSNTVAPYKRQVDLEMNNVIGKSDLMLTKEQPESTIGNWAADVVSNQCNIYANLKVDFAVLNYGGLRISSIAAGTITKGKIFELMPFDNMLVIVDLKGTDLKALFEHVAANGGWPISKGIRMKMNSNGGVIDVKVNNQSIDPNKTYKVATIDYLANGGDKCTFFAGKSRIETGRFLRDAVIEYIEQLTAKGMSINAKKEGRIVIEK